MFKWWCVSELYYLRYIYNFKLIIKNYLTMYLNLFVYYMADNCHNVDLWMRFNKLINGIYNMYDDK